MTERLEPLWLLAAPFSGVSLLAGSLGCHPDLYVTPEIDLLWGDTVGDALDIAAVGQGTQGHGLQRLVAALVFGRADDEGIRQARIWLEQCREWSVKALIDLFIQAVAPRRLVIPERDAPLRPNALMRLQQASPASRVLHLTRHPWEQGVLMAAWARERLYVPLDFKDHAQDPPQVDPQLPWLRANVNVVSMRKRLPPERSFHLAWERLRDDFDGVCAALCGWLEIADDASISDAMSRPAEWLFGQPGPGLAPGGLEPEAFEAWPENDLRRAARCSMVAPLPWRKDKQPFTPEVQMLAKALGYS